MENPVIVILGREGPISFQLGKRYRVVLAKPRKPLIFRDYVDGAINGVTYLMTGYEYKLNIVLPSGGDVGVHNSQILEVIAL